MEKEKSISMPVINEHAAGIDVGSRSHYVAIGQSAGDVSKFSVYTKDNMVEHLVKLPGYTHKRVITLLN